MSAAATARAREQLAELPIDLLIAALEDALHECGEIDTRRSGSGFGLRTGREFLPSPATIEQYARMRECRSSVELALSHARQYAKGPRA